MRVTTILVQSHRPRRLNFDPWLIGILTCAIALYLIYASYTDIVERNYDGPERVWYSNYIAEHGHLPPANQCTICRHPPLYFALGALVIRLVNATHLATVEVGLQGLSLLLFVAFLIFGVLTIRLFTDNRATVRLGAALLAFWPTSVINSVRVHDDLLASSLGAAVLYLIIRWQKYDRVRNLYWAIFLTALALFTKANAYALVLLLLATVSWQCYRDRFTRVRVRQVVLSFLSIAAAIVGVSSIHSSAARSTACQRALGAICDYSTEHFVGNGWANYLTFDLKFFLRQPYLINDPYDKHRDYVLNTLLKTSLFSGAPLGGEFEDRLSAGLAIALSYLTLGIILVTVVGVFGITVRQLRRHWVIVLASLLLLGQLIALRVRVPLSMHSDFRYIFTLLIPACVCYAKLSERWRLQSRTMFCLSASLVVLLIPISIVFFRPASHRQKGHATAPEQTLSGTLASFSAVLPPDTAIDSTHNLQFGPNQVVEFQLPEATLLSKLDLSADANNQYEILIFSPEMQRRLLVGPQVSWVSRLARYKRAIAPPIRNVHTIRIRALQGNGYYTLGHLAINRY